MGYRVHCKDCSLDHIHGVLFDAEKEKKKHEYMFGHEVVLDGLELRIQHQHQDSGERVM